MTAFYELKNNKIISTVYTLYPSYAIPMSGSLFSDTYSTSSFFYLFDSASIVQARYFFDSSNRYTQGAAVPSGTVWAFRVDYSGSAISGGAATVQRFFTSSIRLSNIYFSAATVNDANFVNQTFGKNSVFNIPSLLYGSEIKPGSVSISVTSNPSVNDDGYGGMFVGNTRVGCVLYQHGMIVLNNNWSTNYASGSPTIYFSGTYKVPMNLYLLDLPKGDGNFTTNPSYVALDTGSNTPHIVMQQPKTYPTAIGLYNADYELMGVVKLSNPIFHDEKTPAQVRAKLNF